MVSLGGFPPWYLLPESLCLSCLLILFSFLSCSVIMRVDYKVFNPTLTESKEFIDALDDDAVLSSFFEPLESSYMYQRDHCAGWIVFADEAVPVDWFRDVLPRRNFVLTLSGKKQKPARTGNLNIHLPEIEPAAGVIQWHRRDPFSKRMVGDGDE